jgi:hypothetical protein
MSTLLAPAGSYDIPVEAFGRLTAVSRAGGQGRVHRPALVPDELVGGPVVVKLYHRQPPAGATDALAEMVAWGHSLDPERRAWLHRVAAWPLATVSSGGRLAGVAMEDVRGRFAVPFLMPSGRAQPVLLALEHLLGGDWYLERRGLPVRLGTATRAYVAERIAGVVAFLHREAIVIGDLAPSNVLIRFGRTAEVCFIDCDSMVFRGRRALSSVETGDWNMPYSEPAGTRAADAYKLGLVVLRLFARSHDARGAEPHLRHVPAPLRPLLVRALDPEPAARPTASEWQRALAHVVSEGGLDERYPGPALHPPVARPVRRTAAAPRTAVPAPAFRAPPRGPLSPLLWLALVIAFILLVAQLFAALPAQQATDSSGGGQYYYVVPGSR